MVLTILRLKPCSVRGVEQHGDWIPKQQGRLGPFVCPVVAREREVRPCTAECVVYALSAEDTSV